MNQLSLLAPAPTSPEGWQAFDLPDADVSLLRGFLSAEEGEQLLRDLIQSVPWRQDTIKIFGKEHLVPRLQQWFGEEGLTYTWSGIQMNPEPWPAVLANVKRRLEEKTGRPFNTALVNRYRSGADTVGWHADDEPELGINPAIASVSVGGERDFVMRHNTRTDLDNVKILLPHGSLLLMAGATQSAWQHSLPRRKRVVTERINLTFRYMEAQKLGSGGAAVFGGF